MSEQEKTETQEPVQEEQEKKEKQEKQEKQEEQQELEKTEHGEEKEEEEDSDEDSGEVEAEHLHFEGVDYGLLPNGDVYTEEGEYAGKWDPTKQKIMKEEEIAHEHLKHRLTFAPQELKGLEGCFEMIDEDKSGTLDFNEISKMLVVAGCIVKDEVLLDIFPNSATIGLTVREFINVCSRYKDDPEKGPVIDSIMKSAERFALKTFKKDEILDKEELDQLRLLLRKHSYGTTGFDPTKIFKRWDKDKDGMLDFDEMHDLIFSLGPDLSEIEYEQFFQYLDHDGDDKIQEMQFSAFIRKETGKIVRKKNRTVTNAQGDKHFIDGMRDDPGDAKLKRFDGRATGDGKWSADNILDENEILTVKKRIRAAAYYGAEGCDVRRLFNEWDKDHNGTLDREELEVQLKRCLPKSGITTEELTQLIDKVDTGGDGEIQVEEFVKFVETNPEKVLKSNGRETIESKRDVKEIVESRAMFSPAELVELQKSFQKADINNNGEIEADEMKAIFDIFDADLSDEALQSMIKHVDINNDGVIDFGEFIIMCANAKKNKLHDKIFDKLAAFAHIASEKVGNADDVLDATELDQIRIRWRTQSYSTKGLDVEGLFKIFDRDKDDRLSYDDLHHSMKIPGELSEEEFSQFFNYLDHDDDDYVRLKEFKAFIMVRKRGVRKRVDKEMTLAMSGSMFNAGVRDDLVLDPISDAKWNPDGVLDDDEIMMIKRKVRAASYGTGGQNIKRLFAQWDKDQSGNLDLVEISTILKKILPKAGISDKELQQFLKLLDKDDDGQISLQELEDFLKPKDGQKYISAKKAEKIKARKARKAEQEKARLESLNDAKSKAKKIIQKVPTIDNSHQETAEYKLVHTVRDTFGLQEINEMKKQFRRLDKDDSKKLDKSEVAQMFNGFNVKISEEELNDMIKLVDIDGVSDGLVDIKEFLYMCALAKKSKYADKFEKLSHSVEKRAEKNPPKLSEYDLQQILLNFRDAARTLRGIDPLKLFRRLDKDKDGFLNDAEFKRAVKSIMPDFTPAQFNEFQRYMNTTGTGKIGIAEFCHFVDQKPTVKRTATSKVDGFSSNMRAGAAAKKVQDVLHGKLKWTDDKDLPQEHILQTQSTILSRSYKMYGTDLEALFTSWDRDFDGKLSFKEFYMGLRKFLDLSSFSRKEYIMLWQHLDRTKNGFIELDELEAFLERDYYDYGASEGRTLSAKELDRLKFQIKIKAYGTHGEDLYQLFQKWDKDDSGTMSKKEFRNFLNKIMPGVLSPAELSIVLNELDKEGDNEISFAEFETFVNAESHTLNSNKKGKLKQTYDIEPDVFDKLMPSELLQALKISHFKRTEEKELDKVVAELGMTYEDEEEAKKLRKAFPNAEVEWAGKKKDKEREKVEYAKKLRDAVIIPEGSDETWRVRDDDPEELLATSHRVALATAQKDNVKTMNKNGSVDRFFAEPNEQKISIPPTRGFVHGVFAMPNIMSLQHGGALADDFDVSWKELNVDYIDLVLSERHQLQEIMEAAKMDQIYNDQKVYPRYQYEEHNSHDRFVDTLTGRRASKAAREKQKLLTKGMSTDRLSPTKSFGTQTEKKKRKRRKKKKLGTIIPSPPKGNASGAILASNSPRAGKNLAKTK